MVLLPALSLVVSSPSRPAQAEEVAAPPPAPLPSLAEFVELKPTVDTNLLAAKLCGMPGYRSRGLATGLAIGSTVAAWAMMAGGIALEDDYSSLGRNVFSRRLRPRRRLLAPTTSMPATQCTLIRGTGLTIFGMGATTVGGGALVCGSCGFGPGAEMMVVGGLTAAAFGLHDWFTAADAVDEYNLELAKRRS